MLSPYLFNVYVDELSEELNKCNVGCNLKLMVINYKLLIITFFKCFLACPNMKAPATYAHFLTFNAASL